MRALLLAGGFGTRLRPLTYTRPKHLLPIANRPHIEHVLDLLSKHDVEEIVLTTSYLAEAFAVVVDSARERGLQVEVTHEPRPLGTAGAIKNAEALIGDDPFLVLNADVLTDADLTRLTDFHTNHEADVTILLTPVDDPSAYGVVPTDDDGRVQGFIEKPPAGAAPTDLINAGVYVMQPRVLERIPPGEQSAERSLFPELVREGERVFALSTDAYWIDIGTPTKFIAANLDALTGRFECIFDGRRVGDSLFADGASAGPGARVSSCCLGAGATVGPGATVARSVLLPDAVVGPGAVVRDSVLGERVRVAAMTTIAGEAIGDEDVIEGKVS